jgi:predicted oxidoreductase (fatty acid repression mutant protein)
MKKINKNLNRITKDFIAMMKERRSNYAVDNKPILTDSELISFINDCVDNAPSSFNYKTQKLVILFGEKHRKL